MYQILNLQQNKRIYSPGQAPKLQFEISVPSPAQVLPPFEGAGSLHARPLCFVPDPHVTVQVP